MAEITKVWLASDAIDEQILTNDVYSKGRNNADDGNVNMLKVNTSDKLEFASVPQVTSDPSADNDLTRKSYVTTQLGSYQLSSEKNQNSGYCGLDAGGKVAAAQLPSTLMDFRGTWAASTNTPALADGTGSSGDVYLASDAGTVDFGAGNITFAIGDWAVYSGSIWEKSLNSNAVVSVNSTTGAVVLDADDISDAATTNKFATAAQLTKVDYLTVTSSKDLDTMASNISSNNGHRTTTTGNPHSVTKTEVGLSAVTNVAQMPASYLDTDNTLAADSDVKVPSQKAIKSYVDTSITNSNVDAETEIITLDGADITAQYVDLGFECLAGSINCTPVGAPLQTPGTDYTIGYTSGAGSVTRITFAGDMASKLVATDKIVFTYIKA